MLRRLGFGGGSNSASSSSAAIPVPSADHHPHHHQHHNDAEGDHLSVPHAHNGQRHHNHHQQQHSQHHDLHSDPLLSEDQDSQPSTPLASSPSTTLADRLQEAAEEDGMLDEDEHGTPKRPVRYSSATVKDDRTPSAADAHRGGEGEGEGEGIEESDPEDDSLPYHEGELSKWTNYLSGWQSRWIVLRAGALSYYKSAEDKDKFCRGTIDVRLASIIRHEYDNCRFEVSVSDHVYFLRASNNDEREDWIRDLENTKLLMQGQTPLSRRPSSLSLTSLASVTSTTSAGSSVNKTYQEKYQEVKTFSGIMQKQIGNLLLSLNHLIGDGHGHAGGDKDKDSKAHVSVETKNELFMLKTTAAGLTVSLEEFIELIGQREDVWRRKCERLRERNKRVEAAYRDVKEKMATLSVSQTSAAPQIRPALLAGPDMEEGPHSLLNDEEFYDALETGLDEIDAMFAEEEEHREAAAKAQATIHTVPVGSHKYSAFLETELARMLPSAEEDVKKGGWTLEHEEGSISVYAKATDSADPNVPSIEGFRAIRTIEGITAKELCLYFYDPKYKMEWENTLEKMHVLEYLDANTAIMYYLHKRVWPTAQRDTCVLCHYRDLGGDRGWIVSSFSVDHEKAPEKNVRIKATVLLSAKTKVVKKGNGPLTRADIVTEMSYLANIDPGGWAPAAVVKQVSKRELPKFVKNIGGFAQKHYKDKEIMM